MSLGAMLNAGFTFGEMRAAFFVQINTEPAKKGRTTIDISREYGLGQQQSGSKMRKAVRPLWALRSIHGMRSEFRRFQAHILPKVLRDFVENRAEVMGAGKARTCVVRHRGMLLRPPRPHETTDEASR